MSVTSKLFHSTYMIVSGPSGHLFSALELVKQLATLNCHVLFVVTKTDLMDHLLHTQLHQYKNIQKIFFHRGKNLINIFKNIFTFWKLVYLFLSLKIKSVVSFGTFISLPVLCIAYLFRITTYIHEQNVLLGRANSVGFYFCDKFFLSFPHIHGKLRKKDILIGNLVRKEFHCLIFQKKHTDKKTVLIFGGSLGSQAINEMIMSLLKNIVSLNNHICFIHICGNRTKKTLLRNQYIQYGFYDAIVCNYHDEIWKCYNQSDLVISRAGATTISELLSVKIPAILIPYPYANNHQFYNAQVLENIGSIKIILEKKGWEQEFQNTFISIISSNKILEQMHKNYFTFPIDLKYSLPRMMKMMDMI